MNPNQAAYVCMILAFFLSNLPFLGRRQPARPGPVAQAGSTPIRIALWLILYGVWVATAMALEERIGMHVPKDWSIWPVTIAFFAVLAFPGVVYRFLWRP